MSCCGGKRARLARARPAQAPPQRAALPDPPVTRGKPRLFEYLGHGSLAVQGAVTGTTYRFVGPGDRIEVAYEDAFAMMAQRDVRRVRDS